MFTHLRAIVQLTSIEWDREVDGEEVSTLLPEEMEVEVDIPSETDDHDDATQNIAIDIASDFHGFCIKSAHTCIKTKYHP